MEFAVSRTSVWRDKKPYAKAVARVGMRIDECTCSEADFDARDLGRGKRWRDEGTNHRVQKNGWIARDFPEGLNYWAIEINSLDELLAFQDEVGHPVIVTVAYSNPTIRELEIYDHYRE